MKVITAIYLHCRPDLRDEWLAGVDVDADVEDSLVRPALSLPSPRRTALAVQQESSRLTSYLMPAAARAGPALARPLLQHEALLEPRPGPAPPLVVAAAEP